MTKINAWVVVAVVMVALIASGCAGTDERYCSNGMTLRHDAHGWFCQGFGQGFNFTPRSALKRPAPWGD